MDFIEPSSMKMSEFLVTLYVLHHLHFILFLYGKDDVCVCVCVLNYSKKKLSIYLYFKNCNKHYSCKICNMHIKKHDCKIRRELISPGPIIKLFYLSYLILIIHGLNDDVDLIFSILNSTNS